MIGVVAIGMTFVITGGGIDLSVGAILALSSVWATTLATREMAIDTHWSLMVLTAVAVGAGCGLVNGILIAYGKVVAFVATLAMLVAARGLAEIISEKKTQIATDVPAFFDFFTAKPLGIDMSIWIFVLVAVVGLDPAQPHHLRAPHLRRRRQPGGRPARRHQRAPPHRAALRAGRGLLRHRRAARSSPARRPAPPPTASLSSSTPSPRSSSAARCSPVAAAPSPAPCSGS